MCAKFQFFMLIWKNLTGIYMYTLKLILVPNFSSLAWISFSSAVNSCYQLLTADDSCYEKNLNGIFIYPLKLIPVPSLSSVGCLGAWLESVTPNRPTDQQTNAQCPTQGEYSANSGPARLVPGPELSKRVFFLTSEVIFMLNFSSPGCSGARLESVTYAQTHRRQTDAQTPGEYSANSGPAGLVPGPELSNLLDSSSNYFYN